jgi:hypothetical protein
MAEETSLVADWLFDTLAADSAGAGSLGVLSTGITSRIYDSLIDQAQTTFPCIVFSMQVARDDLVLNNARRVWAQYLFQVKVIGKNHAYSQLTDLASRIDTLINRGSGTPTGGNVITCVRERTLRFAENPDEAGIIYRHLGGLYDMIVQAT